MTYCADVCLIVEGAYPYVTGGVSSWIQSLITHLPDVTFAIVYIGARPDPQRKALYKLPKNVVELREVFINDIERASKGKRTRQAASLWHEFSKLHEAIAVGKLDDTHRLLPVLRQPGFAGLESSNLFQDRESWDVLVQLYELHASTQSFVDFFWTFRYTYLPIFTIFETALPQAHVYHAVSTGFSGLLGALTKIRTGRPFLVTEHGIYTREREIEIVQSDWIEQPQLSYRAVRNRMSFFQDWWFNIYRFMEKMSYDFADAIISITGVNQTYQVKHGANPQRLKLIPNGINVQQLAHLRQQKEPNSNQFLIGFVGRVVPIKDVKTFIRALKIASQTIPHLEAYLVGPTEEDLQYFQECQRLVEMLNLTDIVHFTGSADVKTYYSQLDVLVLTSLSEGQPLVILEGNCAGIPVVATDVGACRELLVGISQEDQALGESGLVTPVASPDATARAMIQLWQDKDLCLRMGSAGQERVRRYYQQEQLYRSYSDLYQEHIEA